MPDLVGDFQTTYGPLAHDIAGETGLDPSVVLGQIAQETGFGQHIQGNNLFGISPGGKLASYNSVPEAAQAYVDLIKSRYGTAASAVFPRDQAQLLASTGYNRVDPTYGKKVGDLSEKLTDNGFGIPSAEDVLKDIRNMAPQQETEEPAPSVENALRQVQEITGRTPPATAQAPQTAQAAPQQGDPANQPVAPDAAFDVPGVQTSAGIPQAQGPLGKIADETGRGFIEGWNAAPPGLRTVSGLGSGLQHFLYQTSQEAGVPESLSRDLAALPAALIPEVGPAAAPKVLAPAVSGGNKLIDMAGSVRNKLIGMENRSGDLQAQRYKGYVPNEDKPPAPAAAPATPTAPAQAVEPPKAAPQPQVVVSDSGVTVDTPHHMAHMHDEGDHFDLTHFGPVDLNKIAEDASEDEFKNWHRTVHDEGVTNLEELVRNADGKPIQINADMLGPRDVAMLKGLADKGYNVNQLIDLGKDARPVDPNAKGPAFVITTDKLPEAATSPGSVGAAATNELTGPKATDYPSQREYNAARRGWEAKQRDQVATDRTEGGASMVDRSTYVPNERVSEGMADFTPGKTGVSKALEEDQLRDLHPEAWKQFDDDNSLSRLEAYENTRKDPGTLQRMEDARDATAKNLLGRAWETADFRANPQPVVDRINQMLNEGGSKRPAIANALQEVHDSLFTTDRKGEPMLENDPRMLYAARQNITDMLSKGGVAKNPAITAAKSHLTELKDMLDNAISKDAPQYKVYLQRFQQMSKPIDEAETLDFWRPRIVDSRGNITLNRIQKMINTVVENRSKRGINPDKSVSDETMETMFRIRNSLARQEAARDMVRSVGSNTAKKLQTANFLDRHPVIDYGTEGAMHTLGAHMPIIGNMLVRATKDAITKKLNTMEVGKRLERIREIQSYKADAYDGPGSPGYTSPSYKP